MTDELGIAIGRPPCTDECATRLTNFFRILSINQTKRHLGRRLCRDDGLRPFAGIAADDAIDVATRARGYLLDQQPVALARRDAEAHLAEEAFGREVERC